MGSKKKSMGGPNQYSGQTQFKRSTTFMAVALAFAAAPAWAGKINSGNPDVEMVFDTTVRYNSAWRTKAPELGIHLTGSPYSVDEGDYQFSEKRDLILSRFDLYSEFDINYRNEFGARLSATAWSVTNFPNSASAAPAGGITPAGTVGAGGAGSASYPGGVWTDYMKRYYRGPSGEFMDAFVWGNFKVGSTYLDVKAGRLAWLPGEYLMSNGNSISFSMAPNDGSRGAMSPGANAKETAMPISQIAASWQLNDDITVMAQNTFEFRSSRIPEGGTFYNMTGDLGLESGALANSTMGNYTLRGSRLGEKGDVGLGLKWAPKALDGDAFQVWYRKFDDKNPSWLSQINQAANGGVRGRALPATPNIATAVYAKDIELLGLTYNTTLGGFSVGAELNYRKNMPLAVASANDGVVYNGLNPAFISSTLEGPRGETTHALLSGVTTLNKNAVFSSGVFVAQLDYMHLNKITKNPLAFAGNMGGVAGRCIDNEILRGCATRDAASFGMNFTPTWQQVFPSIDISMPTTVLYGLKGSPAATGTGILAKENYIFKIGGRLEYLVGASKHQFDLAFATQGGPTGTIKVGSALNTGGKLATGAASVPVYSGLANFRDRNYISFTYQTAF